MENHKWNREKSELAFCLSWWIHQLTKKWRGCYIVFKEKKRHNSLKKWNNSSQKISRDKRKMFPKKVCPETKMFYLRRNMFTSETVSKNNFSKSNMSVCKKASKYIVPVNCFSQKDNKLSRGMNISSWQAILAWSKTKVALEI